MGNKPQHSKYDENGDRWILKFLVRIEVLVPGPMNDARNEMVRIMNNPVLRKQISRETFAEYRRQCKQVRSCKLIIPNDWQDHAEEFRIRVSHISLAISANWFNVALYYCYYNFNERETYERCKIERQTLPHRGMAPFMNDFNANPWYFMNKILDNFEVIPSFANLINHPITTETQPTTKANCQA